METQTNGNQKKRSLEDTESSNEVTKRQCTEAKKEEVKQTEKEDVPLTSEQIQLIEKNRAEALKRLQKTRFRNSIINTMSDDWKALVGEEFGKQYFKDLLDFLEEEQKTNTVFPPNQLILSAFKECPLSQVKVVIIGQDPYHGKGQAHGLAFSVQKGVKPPPSLLNIYKELSTCIDGFKQPDHGCLIKWCNQGVLLLNTSLTVRAHTPASHSGKGWEQFTDSVIRKLCESRDGLIFLLWGNHAQSKRPLILNNSAKRVHVILEAKHPSPYSANSGFFGCKHFKIVNDTLKKNGKTPIDWSL